MILGCSSLDSFVYGCFAEKEKKKSKIKPPLWWLKGKEICVQGADVYDEKIRGTASGDPPEELFLWTRVHGFDIASDAEALIEQQMPWQSLLAKTCSKMMRLSSSSGHAALSMMAGDLMSEGSLLQILFGQNTAGGSSTLEIEALQLLLA